MTGDLTREDIAKYADEACEWLTAEMEGQYAFTAKRTLRLIGALVAVNATLERRLHMIATEATAPVRLPAPTTPSDGPEAQSDPAKP